MNFKTLALTSVLALGSIFGSVPSAEAATARCWVGSPTSNVSSNYCEHFLPENGEHVVYLSGTRYEFHLYDGGRAVIYVEGKSIPAEWVYHSKGGIQVENLTNGYWFVFDRN